MANIESLTYFIPELILSATAIALIMLGAWPCKCDKSRSAVTIAGIGIVLALIQTVLQWDVAQTTLFFGMLTLDRSAIFFKIIFSVTALLVLAMSQRSKDLKSGATDSPEYYALIIGSLVGMNLLASTNNLLMIYLALEFVSLMSYILVGYVKNSARSGEAALKYILFGAVASGLFLYGASLFFGITGSLDLSGFLQLSSVVPERTTVGLLAAILMLAGFLYKIAAVPMHAWCPDAYEGAPTPITAFLSVAPKAAGFAILLRAASQLGMDFHWPIIIAVVSAITMTLGNLVAIPQENVKRLLAYSSIAHAGYLLMGVACMTPKGNEAVYFYMIAYLVMNIGAFLVIQIVSDHFGAETIDSYKGLGRRGPYGSVTAIAMTIFLLSLTGVPPFFGFIGKFYIFSAVIDAKLYWLAIVGIANSVVSLYYYMRIVRAMFLDPATDDAKFTCSSRQLATIMVALAVATVVFGLAWQWFAEIVI